MPTQAFGSLREWVVLLCWIRSAEYCWDGAEKWKKRPWWGISAGQEGNKAQSSQPAGRDWSRGLPDGELMERKSYQIKMYESDRSVMMSEFSGREMLSPLEKFGRQFWWATQISGCWMGVDRRGWRLAMPVDEYPPEAQLGGSLREQAGILRRLPASRTAGLSSLF